MDAAEAGTACATEWPQRRGKDPCGVSGTGIRADGLDDGREGLQHALSVLPNPATADQEMMPFDRR